MNKNEPIEPERPVVSGALTGSEAYLADDVSVGMVARWINDAHLDAAKESPPNLDYMRAMQRLGAALQSTLDSYRRATTPLNQ